MENLEKQKMFTPQEKMQMSVSAFDKNKWPFNARDTQRSELPLLHRHILPNLHPDAHTGNPRVNIPYTHNVEPNKNIHNGFNAGQLLHGIIEHNSPFHHHDVIHTEPTIKNHVQEEIDWELAREARLNYK